MNFDASLTLGGAGVFKKLTIGLSAVIVLMLSACTSGPPGQTGSTASAPVNPTQSIATDLSGISGIPSAQVSVPPAVTTDVPAPGGGDINQTVAEVPVTTNSPIDTSQTADLGGSVTANIVETKNIDGIARGAGEVGGPAIALTIEVNNGSGSPIELSDILVTAEDNAGTPAGPLSGDPASPLTGTLASEESAKGVFVFTFPSGAQEPMNVAVSYAAGFPVALFAVNVK
jgi:hypothetical protein